MNPPAPPPPIPQPGLGAAELFPCGWPQRLWFLWAAAVLPLFSFVVGLTDLGAPRWQRPDAGAWLQLLLNRPGALAFAPLAAVAVATAAAVFWNPGPWVTRPLARTGLLIGFLYGLQYSLLVPASLLVDQSWRELPGAWRQWSLVLLFVAGAYAATWAIGAAFRRLRRKYSLPLLMLAGAPIFVAILIAASFLLPGEPSRDLELAIGRSWMTLAIFLPATILMVGPAWTADAYARVLLKIGKPSSPDLPYLLPALLAYLLSWRFAINRAVDAYQALPATKPTCFVATAAARGPSWLTGAFDGPGFRACPQLQRFKLFELALEATLPRCHRRLRQVYDRVGPKLAAKISTPGRAALAWLALRPAELAATGLLRLFAGREISRRASSLYRSDG